MSKEDVRALVLRSAQEQDLPPIDLQVTRKIRVHSHTSHPTTAHYRARSKDGTAEYCIKLFDTSTKGKRMFFQREADVLEHLNQKKLSHSVAMTPAVHLADAKSGILVMDWLNGFSVKSSLTAANYSTNRRNRLLQLSAQWLRQFHEVWGIEKKPSNASAIFEKLQVSVHQMTDHHRNLFLCDETIKRAIALLGERASTMDALSVDWSLYHRDFTPSNLIVSHNGAVIRGIDFGKASENAPVSLDLATFIVRAHDIGTGLVFAGASADASRLSVTIEVMLSEYSPRWSGADRDWIMWCVLYWSVYRIVVYHTTSEPAASWNIPRRMTSHLKERKSRLLVQAICSLL